MAHVSCSTLEAVFAALGERGILPAELAEGSCHPLAHLQNPNARIEWHEYTRLLERFEALYAGPDAFEAAAACMATVPASQTLIAVGRLAWTDRQFWRAIVRYVFPSLFPHLSIRLDAQPLHRFRVTVEIPKEYGGSTQLLRLFAAILRHGPRYLGRDLNARVEAEVSSHRGVFNVTPPPARSALSRLVRRFRGLAGATAAIAEVENQQQALAESHSRLTATLEDLRRSNAALRDSERRYRALAENASDLIAQVNLQGRIVYVSSSHKSLLGHDRRDLEGRNVVEFVHPDDAKDVIAALGQDVESGTARKVSYRFRHADGSWRWLESAGNTFMAESGGLQVVVVSRDVTERRELEEQLRQAQKMEAVGRLAAGVAHDFNNLLTVISGYADILRNGLAGDDDLRACAAHIAGATESAAVLTRQLLSFSRKQTSTPRILDLNRTLIDLQRMLERLISEQITIDLRLDPAIGHVEADPVQMEQIVVNLAVNASDAMPSGGTITITTSEVEYGENTRESRGDLKLGTYIRLSVRDTGVGMDAETRARAFEPFYTTKEKGKGTGLGLSTVYGIVQRSGGVVRCESAPGAGARFDVDLPRVEAAVTEAEKEKTPARPLGGTETVLIAEDKRTVRELFTKTLTSLGYRVVAARNGEEALELASQEGKIQVLVTDVVMPRMSGFDLADQLLERQPDLRVVFMSGYTDDDTARSRALVAGHPLLMKPFSPVVLANTVRRILDASAHPSAARPPK